MNPLLLETPNIEGDKIQHLIFIAGGQYFAGSIEFIEKIVSMPEVTQIPGLSNEMLGVVNLQGSIIPVIDLALCLGLQPEDSANNHLVAVIWGGETLGIKIASAFGVEEFAANELQNLGTSFSSTCEIIIGTAIREDKLISIIDIPKLFDRAMRQKTSLA